MTPTTPQELEDAGVWTEFDGIIVIVEDIPATVDEIVVVLVVLWVVLLLVDVLGAVVLVTVDVCIIEGACQFQFPMIPPLFGWVWACGIDVVTDVLGTFMVAIIEEADANGRHRVMAMANNPRSLTVLFLFIESSIEI